MVAANLVHRNSKQSFLLCHELRVVRDDATSTVVKSTGATVVKQQPALFDELGRLMRSMGAASQQTNYGYDPTDKLVKITDPN